MIVGHVDNCGHLRIYHSIGLEPGTVFEESTAPCPYCRVKTLEDALREFQAPENQDNVIGAAYYQVLIEKVLG